MHCSAKVHVALLNLIVFLGTHLGSGGKKITPIAGFAVHLPKASPSYLWFDRTKACAQRRPQERQPVQCLIELHFLILLFLRSHLE